METKISCSADDCASELLEVVPVIMRHIRVEMRKSRGYDLTVPQFRTLAYLNANEGASLSDLADHIGLTLPSASKLIDGLVVRELVQRKTCVDDRRRMKLTLTTSGKTAWLAAYQAAQSSLAALMMNISERDQQTVKHAIAILRPVFMTK